MQFTEADHNRVTAAIKAAEARTSGEIFCMLSNERHRYLEWIFAVAALLAFSIPFLLTWLGFGPADWAGLFGAWRAEELTELQTIEIYAAMQAFIFLMATLAIWWSPLAQRYAPRFIRRERVHEMALKQFLSKGIHLTAGRTGVLIFVSAEDHIVEVVADEGIFAKVPQAHWGDTAEKLLAGLRRDDPAQGFIDAIALCGEVLARHFPPGRDNPNEIEDHLIIV